MEVKGIATASVVLSLAALGCLLAALLGPWSWGKAQAAPGTRHQLVAEYDLWQAKLDVVFYPDPALPWKQALAPLRVPSLPLYHFVHGPPAVRLLGKHAERGTPVSWDVDTLQMPGTVEEDYDQQAATWLALTLRRNRKRNTTWTWQSTLPAAADAVEQRCQVAVALQIGSVIAQVSGAAWQKRARLQQAKMLSWCAMLLQVGGTVAILSTFVCYLSRFHSKLHMLAAEFVFAQTDGAILIWPADFRLKLGPCARALALSGLLSLTSSLLLVACLVGTRPKKAPKPSRLVELTTRKLRRSSSTLAAEHLFQASVVKLKSHDRRVVLVVLLAMTLLALLLGLMAFLLGRAGVEDGVSKAFRGPDDGLRKTSEAAQAVGHFMMGSLRTVLGAPVKVLLGVVRPCGKVLASLGHFVVLPARPIIKTLKFIASVVTKGVAGTLSWLAAAANAAAAAAQNQVPEVPENMPSDGGAVDQRTFRFNPFREKGPPQESPAEK